MWSKIGIGGRLLLAFAVIMGLALVSGLVGWLELRQIAGTQATITRDVMPAATEARGVAEASARLIARSPLLTGAGTEAQRKREAEALFAEADELRRMLSNLTQYGFDSTALEELRRSVDRLLQNLSVQNGLVARRLHDRAKAESLLTTSSDAAIGLFELSDTLVANAAMGTSAVIANIYDLIEDTADTEPAFLALDRLVERDLYLMERMFELRLRSSEVALLLNQLNKTNKPSDIEWIERRFDENIRILERRVGSIPDPVRREQAEELYGRLTAANASAEEDDIFELRRGILSIGSRIDRLAEENRQLSEKLGGLVVELVDESKTLTTEATMQAETAVRIGLVTLLAVTAAGLVIAALILWFYVRGRVVDRLRYLANAMRELARGNLAVEVAASGNDELTEMAHAIQFFRDEAVRKRELEVARDRAEAELRRHKEELEDLVRERTQQLSEANTQLQQEVENHAKARKQAERASRAKSDFLATMSHEIRTPMSGMLGMLRILGDNRLASDQREQLATIESSGQALLSILNDILDYSKIESGRLDVERADFDLQDLVGSILSLMRPRAEEKGLVLTLDSSDDVPTLLKGDPGKLRQVLFNLVSNGLKYTDEGGVTLRIECVPASTDGNVSLRFEVADTGIGLTEEGREKAFDAFYQADSSVARRHGGTGLGLAICKKLVLTLGGDIGVDSTPGGGSRFWFVLSFQPGERLLAAAPASSDGPTADAKALGARSILLVEDNEVNRLVAKTFLEQMGLRTTLASDGQEAIDAVEAEDFDAVLMDISLPGMDGLEATRRIRAMGEPSKRKVPIIAMSAHVFTSEIDEHLRAGMDAFIGKPISPERLGEILARVLLGAGGTRSLPAEDTSADDPADAAREALAHDLETIGAERTERMVNLFLRTAPEHVQQLRAAIEAGDFDGVAFAAHNLKNSASSLGLTFLADRSSALEAAAKAKNRAELANFHKGLGSIYEQSARLLTETWALLRA